MSVGHHRRNSHCRAAHGAFANTSVGVIRCDNALVFSPAPFLQGRYHVPFIAPVLVTVFTLALHSVGLPFVGYHATNLSYMPAVKILFAVQLVAAAAVYAAVTLGMTPEGLEERVGQMQIVLSNHSVQLGDISATLANHSVQLGDISATQANHSVLLGDMSVTQANHSDLLGDMSATQANIIGLLYAITRHFNISASG